MRKLIVAGLMAATLVPSLAVAQTGELRGDRRDVREEQRDVNRAIRNGAPGYVVRDERNDVRDARREYREDWRDWRRSHPDVYRGAGYVGPRGYAYRPVAAGYRFQPAYYGQRYWVDPVRYHLPVARPGHRWVRYGRDVAMVDLSSGRAVTVYNGFFY